MAVTVKETFPEFNRDENGSAVVRTYLVRSTTPMDYDSAVNATGLPAFNSALSAGSSLRALGFTAKSIGDAYTYEVTVQYRRPKSSNNMDPILSPTYPAVDTEIPTLLPIITAAPANEMVVAERAYDSEGALTVPIVNSVGDLFDTPPMTMRVGMMFTVRWFRSTWTMANEITYANTVNDAAVTICGRTFPAGTAHLQSIVGGMIVQDDGTLIWEVEAQIHYRPEGHVVKLLDNGFRALDAGGTAHYVALQGGSYVPVESASEGVTDPVLLDGDGHLLVTTPPLVTTGEDPDAPVYLEFTVIKPATWTNLYFPTRPGVKG